MYETIDPTIGRWKSKSPFFWENEVFPIDYNLPVSPFIQVIITEDDIKQYFKSKQSDLKNSVINNILESLEKIKNNFNDITYRQVTWVECKENIDSLWNLVDDDNSKSTVLFLTNGIKNLKAEKMLKSHIDGFQKILKKFLFEEISEMNITDIINIFIKYKIPIIRFPKGSSELVE